VRIGRRRPRQSECESVKADAANNRGLPLDLQTPLTEKGVRGKLSIIVENMPRGSQLSAGTNNWDSTWSLTLDDIEGLAFLPAADDTRRHTLSIRVLRFDTDGFDVASTAALFDVEVDAGAVSTAEEESAAGAAQRARLEAERARARAELQAAWEAETERRLEEARSAWEAETEARLAAVEKAWKKQYEDLQQTVEAQAEARMKSRHGTVVAAAEKEFEKRLKDLRREWNAEQQRALSTAVAERDTEAERRLAAARQKWERELKAQLTQTEADWAKAEDKRLKTAQKEWQKEADARLNELRARPPAHDAPSVVPCSTRPRGRTGSVACAAAARTAGPDAASRATPGACAYRAHRGRACAAPC